MKKIVIAGGRGFIGTFLSHEFEKKGFEVIVLSRSPSDEKDGIQFVKWDGQNPGEWTNAIEGAFSVINLSGKSVDCRYTMKNRKLILSSRINSSRAIGMAIQNAENPPQIWINSSSATIYKYSYDQPQDEKTGEIGTGFSIEVCQQWERAFDEMKTPSTRKAKLRISMVLGNGGGVIPVMNRLVHFGLGGTQGKGNQYVSWIHEMDVLRIIEFIHANNNAIGAYNCTAPNPVINGDFMKAVRKANNVSFGIPSPGFLIEIGAFFLRTESELVLKSRNVVPGRLLEEGFEFKFPELTQALNGLKND